MATYKQNLTGSVGGAMTTMDMDTITVGKVQPKLITGAGSYTCKAHEVITYVKSTGNAATDVPLKVTDMAGNVIDISVNGIEDADSLQGLSRKWKLLQVPIWL